MNDSPAGSPAFLSLFADVLEVQSGCLSEETSPATLPAWTSRKHLELVVTLEELYDITLTSQEIRKMTTLGAARRILTARGIDA